VDGYFFPYRDVFNEKQKQREETSHPFYTSHHNRSHHSTGMGKAYDREKRKVFECWLPRATPLSWRSFRITLDGNDAIHSKAIWNYGNSALVTHAPSKTKKKILRENEGN
jgi:hypothetical protein